jgi:hypothetical protein
MGDPSAPWTPNACIVSRIAHTPSRVASATNAVLVERAVASMSEIRPPCHAVSL